MLLVLKTGVFKVFRTLRRSLCIVYCFIRKCFRKTPVFFLIGTPEHPVILNRGDVV